MPDPPSFPTLKVEPGVAGIDAAEWDALVDPDDPFLEHAFLAALERSGSVGPGTGWEPLFLTVRDGDRLVGAAPLYVKDDSMGEFIWDFAWADGALRAGIPYFPKLVAAIPFTPAASHRLLVRPGAPRDQVEPVLIRGMLQLARDIDASSVHVLYCRPEEADALSAAGFLPRASCQYQWRNREPDPYVDFADYLATFRSRNRKQVRRERAAVAGQGLRIVAARGDELQDADWEALYRYYRDTNDRYGNIAALTPEFFQAIRRTHAHRVLAVLAYDGDRPVAATTNFFRGDRLSGRYWGGDGAHPLLHFELCFYRLIEFAIANRMRVFEGGAGGDQKVKRGLIPRRTYSAHFIRHAGLARAIGEFVAIESRQVDAAIRSAASHAPFATTNESW